jgi:hypothetical protein
MPATPIGPVGGPSIQPFTFDQSESAMERKVRALKWLIAACPRSPKSRLREIEVVQAGTKELVESDLDGFEGVLTVASGGIAYWYRPYSQPGAPPVARRHIGGLSALFEVLLRPRWVTNEPCDRLLAEHLLQGPAQEVVAEYRARQAAERALLRKDIRNLVGDSEVLAGLYEAVEIGDLDVMITYASGDMVERTGIAAEHILRFVEASRTNDETKLAQTRAYLRFWILMAANQNNPGFDWHSPEYNAALDRSLQALDRMKSVAEDYFEDAYQAFIARDDVKRIRREIFDGS